MSISDSVCCFRVYFAIQNVVFTLYFLLNMLCVIPAAENRFRDSKHEKQDIKEDWSKEQPSRQSASKVAIEAYSKFCSMIIPCVTLQFCLICHTSNVHLCSSNPRLLLQENLLLLFQLFKCFLYGNLVNPSDQQCHLLSLSICLCF
jgi:hypothetical protein